MSDYEFQLNAREVYRYLGYCGIDPTPEVAERVVRIKNELISSVTPKAIWKYAPLSVLDEGRLSVGDIEIHSRDLYKNLRGCSEVCILAVTIGHAPDRFIKKAEVTEVGSSFFYQAIGAAMVEEYADHINSIIRDEVASRSLYTRPRYSPGYGDFAIEHQRDIAAFLNMSKLIGISLTDACLMVPTKSITAVIGLSTEDSRCPIAGCESCNLHDSCAFRRADE